MGHRTTQRILQCSICGRTPEDGEYMWEMNSNGYWCEPCCDKDEQEEDLLEPHFGDVKEELKKLDVHKGDK